MSDPELIRAAGVICRSPHGRILMVRRTDGEELGRSPAAGSRMARPRVSARGGSFSKRPAIG